MVFNWEEFLELARDLQGRTGSGYSAEAAERTAVSRAYYAAFCHARNYAAAHQGFKPSRRPKDHERLRDHFQRMGRSDPMWVEVANKLGDLRQWRNNCDYDNHVVNLSAKVQSALRSAQKVIEQCR